MIYCILISGRCISCYCLLCFLHNVAFHMANEIALTRSKGLATFIIEVKPYENFCNRLSEDLRKARITAHSIEQFYDFSF